MIDDKGLEAWRGATTVAPSATDQATWLWSWLREPAGEVERAESEDVGAGERGNAHMQRRARGPGLGGRQRGRLGVVETRSPCCCLWGVPCKGACARWLP